MNTFEKDLFDLFGLDKMPPEKAEETLGRLAKLIFQSVLVRVLPMLSDEQRTQYENIADKEEGDVLFKFLRDNVDDFDQIIKEEAEDLKIELTK